MTVESPTGRETEMKGTVMVSFIKIVQCILNNTVLKCIRHTQAGCEIGPCVSPQVGLQSTGLKADWFKRALQS